MRVALIGATGNVGSRVLAELVRRGHTVTAIVRHPQQVPSLAAVTPRGCDVRHRNPLVEILRGHDAVVSSVKFIDSDPTTLIAAVEEAGIRRYIVVGGAGSLQVAPGVREVDRPDFPPAARPNSLKGAEFLEQLKATDLEWTYLSPSRLFVPGQRTGTFRLGTDQLLVDATGKSSISFEDYAVALVDELERPQHIRQRFTVGY